MPSRILLLNGVGSAGKGSIASALQDQLDDVFLHVEMDAFLEMLPDRMLDDADGFLFEQVEDAGSPAVQVSAGAVGRTLMLGMRRAVRALADAGNHLIVDEVATAAEIAEYRDLLADHDLVVIAVVASLDVLEQRERARGDRMIGLARWQFERIHVGIDYDLTVRTDGRRASECAREIKFHLDERIS